MHLAQLERGGASGGYSDRVAPGMMITELPVWRFFYSSCNWETTPAEADSRCEPNKISSAADRGMLENSVQTGEKTVKSANRSESSAQNSSKLRLAGFGVGLPLTRLYARAFGGNLRT